jgi:Kef-type K+ transport system membrane component KefB/nucleotide-binding universal stress UspA family protein
MTEGFTEGIWLELVILGALVWLGYIGARVAGRFNLPSVTGFLLVGIVLGPYGLGLLSLELLEKIGFVNTLALGLIVFLIGEELTGKMLSRHHWSFWIIAIASAILPAILVGYAMGFLSPEQAALAWVLAAIAMSGAPATLMSVIAETKASGRSCDMLLGSAAFSDIATVVAYAAVGPLLLLQEGDIGSVAAAGAQESRELLGGVALGIAVGIVLAYLLRRTKEQGEILAIGSVHVLIVVAVAHILDVSTLLAPLAMGVTVAVMEERVGNRQRCFSAMRTVEYPVYIIFFTLAGAELDFSLIFTGGVLALMLAYIVARSAGKFIAGFGGSLLSGITPRQATWFGLGSLPQAGVAVGLALSASIDYPEVGSTVTAVVLASIVIFELLGPPAAKRALHELGCTEPECEIEVVGPVCKEKTVLMPVSHHWSAEKLLHAIDATDDESDCPSTFVLATVVTPARRYTASEAIVRAQRVLDELSKVAEDEGHLVRTRIVESRSVDAAIAALADDVGADLVVLGTPAPSRGGVTSFVRTPLHKIIDRLSTPVFVVPEGWEPSEVARGSLVASTVPEDLAAIEARLAEDDSTARSVAASEVLVEGQPEPPAEPAPPAGGAEEQPESEAD